MMTVSWLLSGYLIKLCSYKSSYFSYFLPMYLFCRSFWIRLTENNLVSPLYKKLTKLAFLYCLNLKIMNSRYHSKCQFSSRLIKALNYFQFISAWSWTKMLMLSTLCITGKTRIVLSKLCFFRWICKLTIYAGLLKSNLHHACCPWLVVMFSNGCFFSHNVDSVQYYHQHLTIYLHIIKARQKSHDNMWQIFIIILKWQIINYTKIYGLCTSFLIINDQYQLEPNYIVFFFIFFGGIWFLHWIYLMLLFDYIKRAH